jgi:transposase
VPEQEIQELRALLRARTQHSREQTRYVQRLQKTLEEANIKLDSAITDIMGVSGRRMVEAIIAGETNPAALADLADRRIKAPREQLIEALRGRVTDNHRFKLRLHFNQNDRVAEAMATVDAAIARMDQREAAGQASFRALILALATIPGVGLLAATVILAEIGTDMSRFPTAGHPLSRAGLCPGQNETAGKRRSSRLRTGALWLKIMLVQCAWAAQRKGAVTARRNSIGYAASTAQRKQSAPSPHRCSPPSTTCSRMAPNTATSAPATSTAARPRSKPSGW